MSSEIGNSGSGSLTTTATSPAVVVEGLAKAYGATQALDGVSFSVKSGEVHALLGGNGSGKSTAIKVLAGVVPGDAGTFRVGDTEIDARNMDPPTAKESGFRFVHQQPAIFPLLSIAENVAIGYEYPQDQVGRIRWRTVKRRAEEVLGRFGLELDVSQPVSMVRPATQAMIAIARALQDLEELSRALLVLDEPTAALPREEAATLLKAIDGYAQQGLGILFVTHRLEEVIEVATGATVLRDGKVSLVLSKEGITHDRLVEGIVGATINKPERLERQGPISGEPRVSVRSLSNDRLTDVSLEVGKGEIVGVAGLLGSGRSTLLRTLFGLSPIESGEVRLDGEPVNFKDPKKAIAGGVAYVPEDRAKDALFHKMSVVENISMVTTGDYWKSAWLRGRQERRDARELLKRFQIKAPGEKATIGSLSGGNQQKVVLVRWIRRPLKLLLLDEPTQGVDVGARTEIFAAISEAAAQGMAVVMVSSEFEELTLICNRILVIRQGRIVDEIVDPSSDVMELEHAVHRKESD